MQKKFSINAGHGELTKEGFITLDKNSGGHNVRVDSDLPFTSHEMAADLLEEGLPINEVEERVSESFPDAIIEIREEQFAY